MTVFGAGAAAKAALHTGLRQVLNTGAGSVQMGADGRAQWLISETGPPGLAGRQKKALTSRKSAKASVRRGPRSQGFATVPGANSRPRKRLYRTV